ncbi:hypothetical protein SASPL_117979 [Salvia splendens]|uniref:Protein BZR1 homolog n=1 Tax=Salvia splendens TaxID=180675 RepID=A0A8X8ZWT9_SALSN|nr:hypothetical protein SASPL_117979 [Salvia splendens]
MAPKPLVVGALVPLHARGWLHQRSRDPPSPGTLLIGAARSLACSTPCPCPEPWRQTWYPSGTTSPTFSLVSSNPFGSRSLMCTPGTCSPADAPMPQFVFGATDLVKPWEGEKIHEECGPAELELTLGSSKPR